MDLAEMYYELNCGVYSSPDGDSKRKTQKLIDYLFEAGVSLSDIIRVIEEAPKKSFLSKEDLPEWLWEKTLLKKDVFYYHHELQVISKPPSMDMRTLKINSVPFYLEMKIKFDMNSLMKYYYAKANTEPSFMDRKKDEGAMKYLLTQYERVDFIEPIDFLLTLIDYAIRETDCSTKTILQIDSLFRAEVFETVKRKTAEAKAAKANLIINR